MGKPNDEGGSEAAPSVNIDLGLGDLIPAEIVKQAYADGASEPVKQVGKIGTDILKTARLLLAPLQLAAAYQDRFEKMVERISKKVPPQRRIEAPAELVGPVFEKLRYLDDASPLWSMFEEVLTRSVDTEKNAVVHPAFPQMISQLSRDEAWILFKLRHAKVFNVVDTLDYDRSKNLFMNRIVEKSEIPNAELFYPDQLNLYYAHLESMGLVTWPVQKQDPIMSSGVQTGVRRHSNIRFTDFGAVFAEACIPEFGFEKFGKNR